MTNHDALKERIEEMQEETSLSNREAEVRARQEQGLTHDEIADELDIEKSTVDEYSRRITQKREDALGTLKKIPVDEIKARCLSCHADVEDGPILGDFPICEPCFRRVWREWFDEDVEIDIGREKIDSMLDSRVDLLDKFNRALIKQQAETMSGE